MQANRFLDGSVGVAIYKLADIGTWLVNVGAYASYKSAAHLLQNNIPWHTAVVARLEFCNSNGLMGVALCQLYILVVAYIFPHEKGCGFLCSCS